MNRFLFPSHKLNFFILNIRLEVEGTALRAAEVAERRKVVYKTSYTLSWGSRWKSAANWAASAAMIYSLPMLELVS